MEWLKNNWFKLSIILILGVVSFIYIYNVWLVRIDTETEKIKISRIEECKKRVTQEKDERIANANKVFAETCVGAQMDSASRKICMEAVNDSLEDIPKMHEGWLKSCEYDPNFVPYQWGD